MITRSCWSRYSSSLRVEELKMIGLQSGSCFLRAGCHFHQRHLLPHQSPGSCVSQFYWFIFYYLFIDFNMDKMYPDLLHFQLMFHYLILTFAWWIWATAEFCPPSSCWVYCPAAGYGWGQPVVLLETQQIGMNHVDYTSIRNWHLFSFDFSTCSLQKSHSVWIFLPFLALPASPSQHLPLPS